ncbi:MAG TPA: DNA gyrase subunit A [Thermoplasmata archaeon]|nr:DNA gyrase subunit A [Thermoplasmata archaeon]
MNARPEPPAPPTDRVHDRPLEQEMHRSYIDYAMSVIVGRALPDVRDGLKPVQRRILWSMWESGATHDRPYRKSARTVGDVLGKYHPHGDMAVYDALVRMAQPFSLRYPLIDGQGNFGSIDGDVPAAMRYTEARLSTLAEELLLDIEKDTVDWTDNFDGSLQQPVVLPSKLPHLLVNGSAGIAVGMATNMPPHNLGEVVDALLLLLRRPDAALDELMKVLPGPDFPTGGFLSTEGIREAYETGRGMIRLRGAAELRERGGKDEVVITEVPYEVNKAALLELIADLVKTKRIDGITDLRDESDRDGTSVVLELRRDAPSEIVLNRLYEHTPLETSFGVINLCLVGGEPRVVPLKGLLELHLTHRRVTLTRRTRFELKKAEERLHLLEGFLTAIDHIDEVIRIIRRSKDVQVAETSLMGKFLLSSEQAKAILDMRLARLTALEREAVETEKAEKEALIKRLREILASPDLLDQLIVDELTDLKNRFADPRRTRIVSAFTERTLEDLIPDMDVVVLVTRDGYIKRLPLDQYRRQRRGGRGLVQMQTKEEDYVIRTFLTRTHDNVLFFTNLGRVYQLKAYELPEGSRQSKGKAVINLLPRLKDGERVQTLLPLHDLAGAGALVFATRKGTVKRTTLDQFQNIRTSGIQAILLEEKEELVDVAFIPDESTEVLLATQAGQLVRFPVSEIRPMGRATHGVIGVRLSAEKGDRVVAMAPASPKFPTLLSVTTTGFGKRSPTDDYRRTKRGAKGVRTIKTGGRNGSVVAVLPTTDTSEVLVTTQHGVTIRMAVKGIRTQARNTLGVRVIRLDEGDEVRDVVILAPAIETNGAEVPAPPAASPPPPEPNEPGDEGPGEETEEDDSDDDASEEPPGDAPGSSEDEDGEDDGAPPAEEG